MMEQPEKHFFKSTGNIPNNPALPLLIYKKAVPANPEKIEELLGKNSWRAAWRYGVYSFPHYHSTAHEVLGVYRGHAQIRLGHNEGISAYVEAGDVLVIPAGVGHENLGCSADFHVVGGYPLGQEADLLKDEKGNRPGSDERIAKVRLPKADPLYGKKGPLMELWKGSI